MGTEWEVYLFGRERLSEDIANALAESAGRVLVQTELKDPGTPPPLPEGPLDKIDIISLYFRKRYSQH